MKKGKENLVKVFDANAEAYDRYRPSYPKAILDQINEQLGTGASCLEIGCATGQLTVDLVKSGHKVIGIEKGVALSQKLKEKFNEYPLVKIINNSFEDWQTEEKFDAVLSAQAFHWIEMESGIKKITELLDKGGKLLLIWNIDRSQKTVFWQQTSPVYDEYFPKKQTVKAIGHVSDAHEIYLKSHSAFSQVNRINISWEKIYSKADYLGLLSTFSDHMTLEPNRRASFFQKIASLIDQNKGVVQRLYETSLIVGVKS